MPDVGRREQPKITPVFGAGILGQDAVVGYMNDSFQREEDTVRLEGIYEPGALRVTPTEGD